MGPRREGRGKLAASRVSKFDSTTVLQWGHGGDAVENDDSGSCAQGSCFNGATAVRPWKTSDRRFAAAMQSRLQWGHGDDAVENPAAIGATWGSGMCFNGATAMTPWKTITGQVEATGHGFNGATAMTPWKTTSRT